MADVERPAIEPANHEVRAEDIHWVKVPDSYPCGECRSRGGWLPEVDQSNCPACWGSDPYGEPSFCAECEFCCGC